MASQTPDVPDRPRYKWQASYQAAVLETDWTKIQERLEKTESEILNRRLELSKDGGTEENEALDDAVNGLRSLRKDVALWLENRKSG